MEAGVKSTGNSREKRGREGAVKNTVWWLRNLPFRWSLCQRVVCVQVNYRERSSVPHPVSPDLAALHSRLPSLGWALLSTIPGCSLLVRVNTPPYPALRITASIFLFIPAHDQATAQAGKARVQDGLRLLYKPWSYSSFFILFFTCYVSPLLSCRLLV